MNALELGLKHHIFQNCHMISSSISGYIIKRIETGISKRYLYTRVYSSIMYNS